MNGVVKGATTKPKKGGLSAPADKDARMGYKPRLKPASFNVGDIVEINSNRYTRLSGVRAQIVHVNHSRYAASLDKYLVRVLASASPQAQPFWEMELRKISSER